MIFDLSLYLYLLSLLQQFGPQDPRRQTSANEYAYDNYFGANKEQPDSPPSRRPGWSQGGGELLLQGGPTGFYAGN